MTVVRWGKRLEPKLSRAKPLAKLAQEERLMADVSAYPDAFQSERAKRLGMSQAGVWRALNRLNISRKKSLSHPKANPEKRSTFCQNPILQT